ncbi:ribbon-helix-helix protein, CopG family [Acetatifactor muris]|uniref:Ribbon-helix-helix protein, copG family n=1 Tax=Acetatifactor muris TaxID=879566 RepID=A0A2K4ZGW5_9FIRM|nr:ribbon-helix-helix protein, CopG family [Acetatifactor muris]MCR2047902.1 ribbon-helix-helix protein, CopG family [Acetatifactor muris]SOY29705.1 Ribbon-helix-helix protein, copG family [Acetatifactor muris]
MTKKIGRPTDNPKPYKITVRLDEKSKKILDSYCENNGTNQMEAVRRAIEKLATED